MGADHHQHHPGAGEGKGCRWVRDRLPLLAGGELTGADRRKVERHLIACPGCRERKASLAGALGALHAAARLAPSGAGTDPDRADSPSLWPALARQIRESRHEPPSRLDLVVRLLTRSSWPSPRPRLAWVVAAGMLAGALAVAGLDALSGRRDGLAAAPPAFAQAPAYDPDEAYSYTYTYTYADPVGPIAGDVELDEDFGPDLSMASSPTPPALLPLPLPSPPPGPTPMASPLAGRDLVRDDAPVAPAVDRTASRFDYDLDHGTPMGPDGVDVKASY